MALETMAQRPCIQKNGTTAFPVDALRQVMTIRGKSLSFEAPEIEDLLHIEYSDKRTFPLMSLLFPFVDLRNNFHVDHIFPISRFTTARLKKAGFDDDQAKNLLLDANSLSNLQLLEGPINNEKRAAMPGEWLTKQYPDSSTQLHYLTKHLLGDSLPDLKGFDAFCLARRERLRGKIVQLLNSSQDIPKPS